MKLIDKLNSGPDNEGESRPVEFSIRRPDSFRSIARMSRAPEGFGSSRARRNPQIGRCFERARRGTLWVPGRKSLKIGRALAPEGMRSGEKALVNRLAKHRPSHPERKGRSISEQRNLGWRGYWRHQDSGGSFPPTQISLLTD